MEHHDLYSPYDLQRQEAVYRRIVFVVSGRLCFRKILDRRIKNRSAFDRAYQFGCFPDTVGGTGDWLFDYRYAYAKADKGSDIRKEDSMNEIASLKEQIEAIRSQLDKAAALDMTDDRFYSLSLEMDSLIEKYLDLRAAE